MYYKFLISKDTDNPSEYKLNELDLQSGYDDINSRISSYKNTVNLKQEEKVFKLNFPVIIWNNLKVMRLDN